MTGEEEKKREKTVTFQNAIHAANHSLFFVTHKYIRNEER
jgi:hypothetical protein